MYLQAYEQASPEQRTKMDRILEPAFNLNQVLEFIMQVKPNIGKIDLTQTTANEGN